MLLRNMEVSSFVAINIAVLPQGDRRDNAYAERDCLMNSFRTRTATRRSFTCVVRPRAEWPSSRSKEHGSLPQPLSRQYRDPENLRTSSATSNLRVERMSFERRTSIFPIPQTRPYNQCTNDKDKRSSEERSCQTAHRCQYPSETSADSKTSKSKQFGDGVDPST